MESTHSNCCGGSGQKIDFSRCDEILARYQSVKGALIPVLQEIQQVYGYLSKDILLRISEKMQIPISQIYGVVTFYSQFHLNPRGRHVIRVCQGTACHVRGAKAILKALEDYLRVDAGQTTNDLRFTLETVACIGACGLAPVMMVDEDTHGRLTPAMIPEILGRYM
ncbi:MAG: NADH-quinone oxidoreductase subunit NuoE [Sporomusaceae bacterium]|nr:NADH-quinone oxidoreductase subunit NuoE [Sporomusaceae bacterium]